MAGSTRHRSILAELHMLGGRGEAAGVILDLGVTEGTEFNYAFKQIRWISLMPADQ